MSLTLASDNVKIRINYVCSLFYVTNAYFIPSICKLWLSN